MQIPGREFADLFTFKLAKGHGEVCKRGLCSRFWEVRFGRIVAHDGVAFIIHCGHDGGVGVKSRVGARGAQGARLSKPTSSFVTPVRKGSAQGCNWIKFTLSIGSMLLSPNTAEALRSRACSGYSGSAQTCSPSA